MQGKTVLLELAALVGLGLLIPWFLMMRAGYREALSSPDTRRLKESGVVLWWGVIAGALMICGFAPFFGWLQPWYLALPSTLVIVSLLHWVLTWTRTRTTGARIAHLRHSSHAVRAAAARTLGQLHNERAVMPLIEALEDPAIRKEAAEALGCLGDARAVDRLLRLLEDEMPAPRASVGGWGRDGREQATARRTTAIMALGKLKDLRAVDPLIELLGSEDRDIRKSSANALEALGERKWTECVKGEDGNPDFARLGSCGDPRAIRPLTKAVQGGLAAAVNPLAALGGDSVVDTLIAALHESPVLQVRVASVVALGKTRDPRVVPTLIDALHVDIADVRQAAARTLGHVADRRALEPLRNLLSHWDAAIRVAAASALVDLGEKQWKEALRGDTGDLARLKSLGHPVPVAPLINALKDAALDPRASRSVAETLGRLRDPESVDPLIALLRPANAQLRRLAAIALRWVGDRRAVDPLIAVMGEPSGSSDAYLSDVVSALEQLGDERAEPALNRYWESTIKDLADKATTFTVRDHEKPHKAEAKRALLAMGSKAVPPLIGLLSDWRTQYEQNDLLKILGELGDSRAVAPVRQLLSDGEGSVRCTAAGTLSQLGEPDWLEWVKGNRQDFARLAKSGRPEVPAILLKALSNSPWWDRVDAAEALGQLKLGIAVQPLLRVLLDDQLGDVKDAAARALRNIVGALSREEAAEAHVLEVLTEALKSGNATVPELMGQLGDTHAGDALIQALGGAPRTRKNAAAALGTLGQPQWQQWIQGDDEDFVRLSQSHDPTAREVLVDAAQTNILAAITLGRLGDARAAATLLQALQGHSMKTAAEILTDLGDARVVEHLMPGLSAGRRSDRLAAAHCILHVALQHPAWITSESKTLRKRITEPHHDHTDYPNYVTSDCHDPHSDKGLGLSYPDGLPGGDF